MDASNLSEHVKHLAVAANATLNIDERLKLELALDTLQEAMHFEHLHLWGKVLGKPWKVLIMFRCPIGLFHRCGKQLPW
jgi:hypothetical protein